MSVTQPQYKAVLFENISKDAKATLESFGFEVELLKTSLPVDELKEKVKGVHVLGVRSRTHLTKEVLDCADSLTAVGCFCIGTNQVDLQHCAEKGIPVFNSPFANSRSVAELVLSHIIALSRFVGDNNRDLHNGIWNKKAVGCHEVRGTTIGIIGYGHIGSQVSVLCEALGMSVIFYDIRTVMPIGNAVSVSTIQELLAAADFVTLHVPATAQTKYMITEKELAQMKEGSYLLNLSRGTVVKQQALADAINSGHIAGAALDVYETEPKSNGPGFENPLRGVKNVIMSPHIGGSTMEAQSRIGCEVSTAIARFIHEGETSSSVNFPKVRLDHASQHERLIYTHRNSPGALQQINTVLSTVNISAQALTTSGAIGHLLVDVDVDTPESVLSEIEALVHTIVVRRIGQNPPTRSQTPTPSA